MGDVKTWRERAADKRRLIAELIGSLGDNLQACRTQYYLPDSGLPSGLIRTAEIHADVIGSIASALWPPPPDQNVSRYESARIVH